MLRAGPTCSRAATSGCASPTPAQAWTARRSTGCSSRSSPPRKRVTAPGSGSGSGSQPSTASSRRPVATLRSTQNPVLARQSPRCCPPPRIGPRRARRPRNRYRVRSATTATEAVRQAGDLEQTIDLLLTDVVMPEMLGNEVAERIRAIRPHIRVLYMSGYAEAVLNTHGALDAEVALLEKPFSETALLTQVRQAL